MFQTIVKRDGREVPYDITKIELCKVPCTNFFTFIL